MSWSPSGWSSVQKPVRHLKLWTVLRVSVCACDMQRGWKRDACLYCRVCLPPHRKQLQQVDSCFVIIEVHLYTSASFTLYFLKTVKPLSTASAGACTSDLHPQLHRLKTPSGPECAELISNQHFLLSPHNPQSIGVAPCWSNDSQEWLLVRR